MKKFLIIVLMIGMIFAVGNTTFAYPPSVTVDSDNDGGTSYLEGFSVDFSDSDTGTYEFLALAGGWNSSGGIFDHWYWSVNIYDEAADKYYVLGDYVTAYHTEKEARDAAIAHGPWIIDVSQPTKLWFYVNDSTTYNNYGSMNVGIGPVAVVPEPVSSTLFVIGGIMFAGRKYLGRRKGRISSLNFKKNWMEDNRR